jgi:hypothetical protein
MPAVRRAVRSHLVTGRVPSVVRGCWSRRHSDLRDVDGFLESRPSRADPSPHSPSILCDLALYQGGDPSPLGGFAPELEPLHWVATGEDVTVRST